MKSYFAMPVKAAIMVAYLLLFEKMLRVLYTILFLHLLPIIVLRLFWRARKAPAYKERIYERFANIPQRKSEASLIWVHAVSVGETIAAAPMVKALQERYPHMDICITTTTPTGSERVRALFGDSVLHYYLPYDLPSLFARFILRLQPALLIVMETELWPNMLAVCAEKGVPSILANGRMSERSAKGYQRFSALTRPMLSSLNAIAAQSAADAERFLALGADKAAVQQTGSIKFDVELDAAVIARKQELEQCLQLATRKVIIFASTHVGEDELLIPMIRRLYASDPELLAFIVPRHPERFKPVARLCEQADLRFQTISEKTYVHASTAVLIGDTMGDMLSFFGLSELAFIGGSLVDHGGHNFLEAAAWSLPITTGPAVFNFQAIADLLNAEGGLNIVADVNALEAVLMQYLKQPAELLQQGLVANRLLVENQGALARLLQIIEAQIKA